jgi:exopolysaccharide biosynthesis polyprenyl glycosylphosphotransferase
MTPPPAATHAAQGNVPFAPRRARHTRWVINAAKALDHRPWARIRLATDVIVLYLAAGAAVLASPTQNTGAADRWLALLFPLITVGVLHARPGPDQRLYGSCIDTIAQVLGVISLSAMLMVALESFVGATHPIALALRFWLFGFVYVAGARTSLLVIRRQAMNTPAMATPTLIIGAGVIGEHLVKRLNGEPRYGLRPIGFIDDDPLPGDQLRASGASLPVLGGLDNLDEVIERTGARRVILAFSNEPDHRLVDRIRDCVSQGVEVSLVPRLFEAINERATLDHVGGLPLVNLNAVNPRGWQFAVKHAVDRTFALLALLALAPLMATIALAVRLSSSGPVMFRQRRVGRDGHEFDLLKFRTMRQPDANSNEFELPDGCAPGGVEGIDRRTMVGRLLRDTSLDELPQFINVLRGDMSLVGPRPERPEFVELFVRDVARYQDRHRVKSGITGWAQVNGLRGQTSILDRVEWDNHYIQNWSLRLDLRIMLLTVAEVLRFRDGATTRRARQPGQASSPARSR